MFTFTPGFPDKNRVRSLYMSDIISAARDSMKQKEIPNSQRVIDAEKAAKLPDVSKWLKADVDAIHKYTRESLNVQSDDVTKINALADLDRDDTVESEVKNIVNEDRLKNALDRAIADGVSLDAVYKNVTGISPNWSPEGVNQFQDSLIETMNIVKSLTGWNAWMVALMTGKLDMYLTEVSKQKNLSPVEIKNPELLSPTVKNILAAAGTIAIMWVTGGIVTAGYETDRIQAEEAMKKFTNDPSFVQKAGNGLSYIKDAFMWRKLSLTFGENKKEWNVDAYYDAIKKETIIIMGLDAAGIENYAPKVMQIAEKAGIDTTTEAGLEKVKKALIQQYIISEGRGREGTDWKFQLGLLFIGANRDTIDVKAIETKESAYNTIERTITKTQKQKSTSVVSTIPEKSENLASQQAIDIKNFREYKDNYALSSRLYNVVGHSDPEAFRPLLQALASQDGVWVIEALTVLEKSKYKSLARSLKADIANMSEWTTYMYGKRDSRTKEKLNQSNIDNKIRTKDVIRRENELASAAGITQGTSEENFRVDTIGYHEPIQVSQVPDFVGQSMTLSVFATPSVIENGKKKTGVHRIDTMDGSIAMSKQYVSIEKGEYRNQIIDATLKSTSDRVAIYEQVSKFNNFLQSQWAKNITVEQYVDYLKSGDTAVFGIEWLVADKTAKVFEGRAMIAGNVCMNRMHGIIYPQFSIRTPKGLIPQPVEPVDVKDWYSEPLNAEYVDTTRGALGLNPIAAALRLNKNNHKNHGGNDSNSTPWDNGGEKIPDSTSTPWSWTLNTGSDIAVPPTSTANSGAVNSTIDAGIRGWSRG